MHYGVNLSIINWFDWWSLIIKQVQFSERFETVAEDLWQTTDEHFVIKCVHWEKKHKILSLYIVRNIWREIWVEIKLTFTLLMHIFNKYFIMLNREIFVSTFFQHEKFCDAIFLVRDSFISILHLYLTLLVFY